MGLTFFFVAHDKRNWALYDGDPDLGKARGILLGVSSNSRPIGAGVGGEDKGVETRWIF